MIEFTKDEESAIIERVMRRVKKMPCAYPELGDCWYWPGAKCRDGYGQIRLKKRNFRVHRLLWSFENGPIPKGHCGCHHCDNPSCVNPDHVFIGTDADNAADKKKKGRARCPSGESNMNSKLTQADVNLIRFVHGNGGYTYKGLGKMFGVSLHAIYCIVKNKTWRY